MCVQYSTKCGNKVYLFDSFATSSHEDWPDDMVLQIASLYMCDERYLFIEQLPVQQQIGKVDCGLFALAFAVESCQGSDLSRVTFDQNEMRKHLLLCLERGCLKSFPKKHQSRCDKHAIPLDHSYKFYPCCQMPEFYGEFMVECDGCGEWIHCDCAGVDVSQLGMTQHSQWLCHSCSKIYTSELTT